MISDGQARRLARQFSVAPMDSFGKFQGNGAITEALMDDVGEILDHGGKRLDGTYPHNDPQGACAEARALVDYFDAHGERGLQIGWHLVWDDTVVPWNYGR